MKSLTPDLALFSGSHFKNEVVMGAYEMYVWCVCGGVLHWGWKVEAEI